MAFTGLAFSTTYRLTAFTAFIEFTRNCCQNCCQLAPAKPGCRPFPCDRHRSPGARTSWNVCTPLLRRTVRNIVIDGGTNPFLTLRGGFLARDSGPIQALVCYHGSTAWCQNS